MHLQQTLATFFHAFPGLFSESGGSFRGILHEIFCLPRFRTSKTSRRYFRSCPIISFPWWGLCC